MKFKNLLQNQLSASSLAIEASSGTVKVSCKHETIHDLDMACILVDVGGSVKSVNDFIFYRNVGDDFKGVKLVGDTLEDDEWDADSEFIISVPNIDRSVSKILFAISPYQAGVNLADLVSVDFFIRKNDQVVCQSTFDLSVVVGGDFILAGVYDLEEMTFNTPGVIFNGDFQTLINELSATDNFSRVLPAALFPNLLTPVSEQEQLSTHERMLHCVWGIENRMAEHLSMLPEIYNSELMANLCRVWRHFPFTQARDQMISTLVKSGADWYEALDSRSDSKSATQNEKIYALIEHVLKNESGGRGWGKSVVRALDGQAVEEYVKQAKPEHNDVIFDLLQQRWMLNYTNEAKIEDVLTQDLGL